MACKHGQHIILMVPYIRQVKYKTSCQHNDLVSVCRLTGFREEGIAIVHGVLYKLFAMKF